MPPGRLCAENNAATGLGSGGADSKSFGDNGRVVNGWLSFYIEQGTITFVSAVKRFSAVQRYNSSLGNAEQLLNCGYCMYNLSSVEPWKSARGLMGIEETAVEGAAWKVCSRRHYGEEGTQYPVADFASCRGRYVAPFSPQTVVNLLSTINLLVGLIATNNDPIST
ncbi:hypothetical protein B0H11DRAFT_1912029 [Mycena galericulata]|nr:hypothetical protein B0H11DRAFT_1912029 [Mycena galericulata]